MGLVESPQLTLTFLLTLAFFFFAFFILQPHSAENDYRRMS
jgi:hypothetical protein